MPASSNILFFTSELKNDILEHKGGCCETAAIPSAAQRVHTLWLKSWNVKKSESIVKNARKSPWSIIPRQQERYHTICIILWMQTRTLVGKHCIMTSLWWDVLHIINKIKNIKHDLANTQKATYTYLKLLKGAKYKIRSISIASQQLNVVTDVWCCILP